MLFTWKREKEKVCQTENLLSDFYTEEWFQIEGEIEKQQIDGHFCSIHLKSANCNHLKSHLKPAWLNVHYSMSVYVSRLSWLTLQN